jgi:hypothetical protein
MYLFRNKTDIKSRGNGRILCVAMLILWASFLIGCGKKAPPVAPRQVPPGKVTDLSYRLDGDTVKLTWTLPAGDEKNQSCPTRFVLYKSRRPIAETECTSCPIRFKRIAVIPVEKKDALGIGSDKKRVLSYFETLEMGFRYIYKVTGVAQNGLLSGDSNSIRLTY